MNILKCEEFSDSTDFDMVKWLLEIKGLFSVIFLNEVFDDLSVVLIGVGLPKQYESSIKINSGLYLSGWNT